MVFYDILFIAISALLITFSYNYVAGKANNLNLPSTIAQVGEQQTLQILGQVRGLYFLLISTVIIVFLLLTLNWSIFKGLNWNIAAKKKFDLKYLKKFTLLNLAWFLILILLIFLTSAGTKQNAAPIFILVITLIAVYLTNILYVLFTKESSLKAVKKTFRIAFTKIHYFVFSYAVIIFFLYTVFYILSKINIAQKAYLVTLILAFTIILAWSRLYLAEVVSSFKLKN
jgi:hypothetical protein